MDIRKIFDGIGKQMLLDFENIQSQIINPGEKGREREKKLLSFLHTYLPSKYALENGEIVDLDSNTSRQCDLVIYDHLNCPFLFAGNNYMIFPVEPVMATVEVKSTLSIAELKDASEKIKSVKNLQRENGLIAGVVFAYTSSWKTDPMGKIAGHLQEINQKLEPYQYIDLICVLDAGVINLIDEHGHTQITKNYSERCMQVWSELEISVLLWFFSQLLDLLDGQTSSLPHYLGYAHGEIGLVRHQDISK
jgi:hypothetical protein